MARFDTFKGAAEPKEFYDIESVDESWTLSPL
jgi:hypothetical protein